MGNEEMSCRERYNQQLEEVRDQRDSELEGILAQEQMLKETARIEHEDQMVTIEEEKAERLREIETEEAVQLEMLRQSREECAAEGNEHAETCREEHDRILDEIRTERDTQLEAVRVQSVDDQLEVMEEAKQELVVMQAQLEQQLKNIREQHYDEIEKIMRKCEGGAEPSCPAFDCSVCEVPENEETEHEATTVATTTATTEQEQDDHDVQAVEEELERLGITSDYRVSLEWESTADLDIYVVNNDTDEMISYRKLESSDGNCKLDVDNRGGERGVHVENISFNGESGGNFKVFVNNHDSNDDAEEIPCTVVAKLGDRIKTFHKKWNINRMGAGDHDVTEMLSITTVNF